MFDIKDNLAKLPAEPGVYLHKDKFGEIIYVGKAASLKSRVRQYFAPPESLDPKTRALASHIAEFEYIVTGTEAEALLLENTLIKKYRPRYNVMLLDDKTYPYLKVTLGDPYPRIVKTRVLKNDGSKYFGPYADVGALNRVLDLINGAYRLKQCARTEFPDNWRMCLNGFLGKCDACCLGGVDAAEYAARIRAVTDFLRGRSGELVHGLRERMKEAAESQNFEEAARLRDLIRDAEAVVERQKVDLLSSGSMDVLLAVPAEEGRMAQAILFFIRDGRLVGREIHHLDAEAGSEKKEIAAAFLKQYYANQTILPKEILLEEPVDDGAAIEAYLSEAAAGFADTDKGNEGGADKGGGFLSSGHAVSQESGQGTENRPHTRVRLTIPERGKKHDLLLLAQKDVRESAELRAGLMAVRQEKDAAAIGQLLQIARSRGGVAEPRIEAYDISHTGGADSVGAMVAFRGAEKSRRDYRRFKIRSEDGADDYGAIQEVLVRRFRRGLAGEKGFDELPDILLIDGGRGHVAAAEQALSALNVGIPVLGMVKDDKHRTRGLVARDNGDDTGAFSESDDARAFIETDLAGFPDLFHLIGTIQEEVHRFAVEYHRSLRGKRAVYSELNDISGIGEKRRAALLLKFSDIEGIRNASADELAAVPGMNQKSADQVFHHFRGED